MLTLKEKEKLWDLMGAIYEINCVGGGAHILLDDFNTEKDSVEFCIQYTKEHKTGEEKDVTLSCLNALLPLSEQDRLEVILEFQGVTLEEHEESLKYMED